MALDDRSMGYELSNVEREIACNPKYENVGYVRHDRAAGYFFLDYSPYKRNDKEEIYYSFMSRPPEGVYVEVRVENQRNQMLDDSGKKWVVLKEVSKWKEFDITGLALQRKILDYQEIIEYFTYPYKPRGGDGDWIQSIASCSCLFAFSSPPIMKEAGGINSAVYGLKYQWGAFTKPLGVIPQEFRKINSDVYYCISDKEKNVKKNSGEINRAIWRPKGMTYDIPIVVDDVSPRNFLKNYKESLDDVGRIVTAQLLDSYIIHPERLQQIQKQIIEITYEMRDKYLSTKKRVYRQNFNDAIEKLASSYARLQTSPEIGSEDIKWVFDHWQEMNDEVSLRYSAKMGFFNSMRLVGDTRNIYYKLCDLYPTEVLFPIREAIRLTKADPVEFEIALDSLSDGPFVKQIGENMMLLDP